MIFLKLYFLVFCCVYCTMVLYQFLIVISVVWCVMCACVVDGEPCFLAGMASSEMLSLSIWHGVRVQPDPSVLVEVVLLAVGDREGHANLSFVSRMNRGVVIFLKEELLVAELIASLLA